MKLAGFIQCVEREKERLFLAEHEVFNTENMSHGVHFEE